MSLKHKVFHGAIWLSGAAFARKIISFATTIVLARILEPTVFGLYALAFVVIDGFGLFKSMGIDSALIQRKDKVDVAAHTAFFIIPSFGIVIYLVLLLCSPVIAYFMESQELAAVICALGLVFVISSFQRVPLVLLERNMKFNIMALTATNP